MAQFRLVDVGSGNHVAADKVVAIVSSESAPLRRLIQSVRSTPALIDATQGKKTKSVIFTTSGSVILSALPQVTLAKRFSSANPTDED